MARRGGAVSFVGYHASHEQFPPSEVRSHARLAEAAGFDEALCSDHFAPFSEAQGQSGFAWAARASTWCARSGRARR